MTTMLRDHPRLPVLPLVECFDLFERARVNFNQLKVLTGYSRMSLYLWRRGDRQPQSHARDRVSTLAHKARVGLEAGTLPLPMKCGLARAVSTFDQIEFT